MADPKPPRIEHRLVESLVPDPRNARTHPPDQIKAIAASLLRYGFARPILADADSVIKAGHGTTEAAKQVYADGGTLAYPNGAPIPVGTVPVLDVTGWTDEQAREYMLADNQLALLSGWNVELLMPELDALAARDFDLSSIGFDQATLDALADTGGGRTPTPPDQFPEFGENIETQHECPKCHYKWSGKSS